jgi:hypothetical protein
MDFTEAASDGGTTDEGSAKGNYILFIEAASRDRQLSRAFYVPIEGIDDNEELNIPIAEAGQHELLAPWIEFFNYSGAEAVFLESESAYQVRSLKSWHDLLLKSFAAKSTVIIEDDEFWVKYSTVTVLLVERTMFKILTAIIQRAPSLNEESQG